MGWYASEELDNAYEEAKELLLPFDLGTWARLFLIVLLTGNGFSMPNMPSSLPGDTGDTGTGSFESTYGTASDDPVRSAASDLSVPMTGLAAASPTGTGTVAAIIGLVLVFVLGFLYISSVFEFIYYQSLLDKKVSIRDNFRRHSGRGARYFGFRLGMMALVILSVAVGVAGLFANPIMGGLMLFTLMLLLIPVMVFMGLTQNFVLLGMMENDTGLVQAWKDFYPELRKQWKQVGVYILVRFAVKIATGVASLIWAFVSLLLLLVPFGILAVLFYMAAPVLAAIPVTIGLITWIVLLIGLQVVFQTYLYYYAILVYHDLTA
ncbi:MAG: hypothetical protein ABEJ64_02845 [Candidatus Nanohaloarchaea archaeon]